jgi:hypothetical protein
MRSLPGTNRSQGIHKGAWFGPATVLGTETRIENGQATPGNIVWIIISDRLWRCAPQQLRRASEREHSQHLLLQPKPWTFENITSDIVLGQYRDVTKEPRPVGVEEDIHGELEPIPEDGIVVDDDDDEMPPDLTEETVSEAEAPAPRRKSQRASSSTARANAEPYVRRRITGKQPERGMEQAQACAEYAGSAFMTMEQTPNQVLEINFPFIEGEKNIRKYLKNPEAFVVTSLKKKRVEIRERDLNNEEKELIRQAKGKEVKEFIKEHVVARLKEGELISPEKIMRMRWILTWKKQPDGEKKGKARLVVLGFEDPFLGTEETSSPTLNKRTKQILLQVCVQRDWKLLKGDVTAAFLQGRETPQSKYCLAPPELAEAMNLPPGERVIRLLKSVYGLTTAPIEWFRKATEVLKAMGAHPCDTDPCVWRYVVDGQLIGLIGAHVDDFLICGDESEVWQEFIRVLMTAFRWTPWEEGKFKQCGVTVTQHEDGSITQTQEEHLATLSEIEIHRERQSQLNSLVNENERTQLRALLGGLQWLVTQSRVDCMVDVNLLQSCVATATVETLMSANKVLRKLRQGPAELHTRKNPRQDTVNLVAWSDASWANRRDGKINRWLPDWSVRRRGTPRTTRTCHDYIVGHK